MVRISKDKEDLKQKLAQSLKEKLANQVKLEELAAEKLTLS